MQSELDILRDVSSRLERCDIAYMLTGSMAMNYYAQPRMTRDIDLVVALALRDTDTVVRLFTPDYYVSRDTVSSSIAHESLFNSVYLTYCDITRYGRDLYCRVSSAIQQTIGCGIFGL